jgi:hypothetical protein
MKERTLLYLSLTLSIASLGYAAWVHHQGSEVLAMRALEQREAELVRHWAPKITEMYRGLGLESNAYLKPPRTLEELFDPLVVIMNGLGGDSDSGTNTVPQ